MQNEIKYIDLFGGVGGFRLGIERAFNNESKRQESENVKDKSNTCSNPIQATTLNCVFYSDIDKYAVQTYNKNFGENHEATDIRTIEADSIPDFDMLCGGFPCQSFSIAGKRRGFEDTRGTLFFEVARIIKAKRPKIVFLENVKGLLNHDKGNTFRTIIQTISELGYDVQWMVLNSKFFGVPQNRERVFIIGSLRGTSRPEILPFGRVSQENNGERNGISNEGEVQVKQIGTRLDSNSGKQPFQQDRVYDSKGVSPALQKELPEGGHKINVTHGTITEAVGTRQGSSKEFIDSVKKIQVAQQGSQAQRVFNIDGLAPTLRGLGGGQGAKTGLYLVGNNQIETEKRKYNVEPEKISAYLRLWMSKSGINKKQVADKLKLPITLIEHFFRKSGSISLPDKEIWIELKKLLEFDNTYDAEMTEYLPYLTSKHQGNRAYNSEADSPTLNATTEPIVMIRGRPKMPYEPGKRELEYRGYTDTCPTLSENCASGDQKNLVVRPVLTPNRENKRQNGRRMKENGEPSFTLTGQDVHGVAIMDLYNHTESSEICPTLKDPCHNDRRVREFQPAQLVNKNRAKKPYNPDDREMKIKVRDDDTSYTVKSATHEFMVKQKMRIRRLTPIECERLQGFPDNWTEGVSDTQRYKQMGNAVTVNVIQAIAEKLLK